MIYLRHDAFERFSVVRESCGAGTCDWCGQQRKTLYRYGTESDGFGARPNWIRGAFCNKDCANCRADGGL